MKIVTLVAASLVSLAAAHAQATAPLDVQSITVQYADLDLDHKAGITALYQRIQNAAHRLCKPNAGEMLVSKRTYLTCLDQAVSTAVARIDRPALSDYVALRTGKPVVGGSTRVAVR